MPLATITGYEHGAWEHRIPKRCLVDRDSTILSLCSGKRVLHLGATDAPFHKDKAVRGELLHQKLRTVAGALTGLDSDADAVAWLREHAGIDDIRVTDVTSEVEPTERYEIILCCDIIEHVTDLGALLRFCRESLVPDGTLVVTTINATAIKPALRALAGREAVHFDHTCYFSYATLANLLLRLDLQPVQFAVFTYPTVTLAARALFNALARVAPGSADGLFFVAAVPSPERSARA